MYFEIGNVMAAAQAADASAKSIITKPVEALSEDEVKQVRQARMLLANVANVIGTYIEPMDGFPKNQSTEQI